MSKFTQKIISLLVGAGIVSGTIAGANSLQVFDPGIIDNEDVLKLTEQFNVDTSYYGSDQRFIAPKKGSIKLNITIKDLSPQEKTEIINIVNELNNLFSIINPKYKFEANFDPSIEDLLSLYTINISEEDISENPTITNQNAVGFATPILMIPTKSGMGVYKAKISIDSSYLQKNFVKNPDWDDKTASSVKENTLNCFVSILCHEVGHILAGLDDAYDLEDLETITVMNSAQGWLKGFSDNDIILIASKMSNSSQITTEQLQNIKHQSSHHIDVYKDIELIRNNIDLDKINAIAAQKQTDWVPLTEPIQLENIGDAYVIDQSTENESIYYDSSSNSFIGADNGNTYITRYYAVEDNNKFTSGLLRISPTKGSIAHVTEIIENFDGILRNPHTRSYFAKSGDNLVQITIREDDYGQRYIHYISSYKTTTKDNYNNTLTDLKSRFSKDGYMSHLSSELADEFPSDLQYLDVANKEFKTDNNKTFTFKKDIMLNPTNKRYLLSNKNNYVFAGDTYMFTKTKGEFVVYNIDYDFFENILTIHSSEKITESVNEKQTTPDMTK